MRHLNAITQAWFVACVTGAAVAPILPNFLTAGVILVGMILLAVAKDRRYPLLSWQDAARAYFRTHRWAREYRIALGLVAVVCFVQVGDGKARGVYIACLAAQALFTLAAPVIEARVEQAGEA